MNPAADSPRLPYIGLRPFDEQDEQLFFGREDQVSTALHQLEDHPFLAVVGPSGSGKSSIVRAGLLPAIRQGFLHGTADWLIAVVRPGHQPYERLARCLDYAQRFPGQALDVSSAGEAQTLQQSAIVAALRGGDLGVLSALDQCGVATESHVLIVVDQFEELFAFRRQGRSGEVAARDEAAGFVRMLLRGCAAASTRLRVVITMRSDFIGDSEAFFGLPEAISQSQFLVPRLNRHQMEEVILRPASARSAHYRPFDFEEDLVNRIINDAGDRSDQLPLMQHALMRTWKLAVARRDQPTHRVAVTHADYATAGGIENAISNHADDAWKKIETETALADIAKQIFLLLCDVSPDGQITRRRPRISEIQSVTGATVKDISTVLRIFQEDDRNFLFPPHDSKLDEDVALDISHESLIRQWKLYHAWVQDEGVSAAQLQRLRDTALGWPEREPLLRDPALTVALKWLHDRKPSPEWAERYGGQLDRVLDFLEASKEERQKELEAAEATQRRQLEAAQQRAAEQTLNARRFRRATMALTVLTIAALAAAVYALVQRNTVRALLQNLAGYEEARDRLRDDVAKLGKSRYEAERAKTNAEVRFKEVMLLTGNIQRKQQELQAFNAALGNIGAALGTVRPLAGGTVAVAFQEGQLSPDKALPALSRVGRVASVDLSHTSVTDAGLRGLSQLKELASLDLTSTDITDAGVARLAGLSKLQELSLSDTMITEKSLPQLETLVNLRSLNVSRTRVNAAAVDHLTTKLPRASIVYVPDPFLDALSHSSGNMDVALDTVKGTRSGKAIQFFDAKITDATLRFLDGYETVILAYCPSITNDGLKILSRHKGLKVLALSNDSQITDQGIENLNVPTLTHLDLNGLALTDRSLAAIGKMTHLQSLRISGTSHEITDTGVAALAALKGLRAFALEFNRTTNRGTVETLAKLPALEAISLMSNLEIPGQAYQGLRNLPRLRVLDISYSEQISDRDVDALKTLTQLETLRISSTGLTPAGVASLRGVLRNVETGSSSGNIAEVRMIQDDTFTPEAVRELPTENRAVTAGSSGDGQLLRTPTLNKRPVQAWTFRGCEKKWVQIDLKSVEFDPLLLVVGADSAFFEVNDDGAEGFDSRLDFLCEDAEYKVAVSSADERVGAFQLTVTVRDGPPAGSAANSDRRTSFDSAMPFADPFKIQLVRVLNTEGRTLTLGPPASGELLKTPTLKGMPVQAWSLKGCAQKRIQIELKSEAFDSLLVVAGTKSPFLKTDDDSGGLFDSRVEFLCEDDEYRIIVSSADNRVGSFRLTVAESTGAGTRPTASPFPSPADAFSAESTRSLSTEGRALTLGSLVSARLGATPLVDGVPAQAWSLKGCAKKLVRIDLKSTEFDPLLVVVPSKSTAVEIDDDGGSLFDSRLEFVCEDDEYNVIVSTADGNIGAFDLSVVVREGRP